jgi:hypothetical protein
MGSKNGLGCVERRKISPLLGLELRKHSSYCCHARLSGQVFAACCMTMSVARTHGEHCLYCCVLVGTCLLSNCLENGSIRHNTESVIK